MKQLVLGERRRHVFSQAPCLGRFWPTTGGRQAMGGGGNVGCCPASGTVVEDPSDVTTMTSGTSISATLTSPINVADQRLPTGRPALQRMSMTARITDQSRMPATAICAGRQRSVSPRVRSEALNRAFANGVHAQIVTFGCICCPSSQSGFSSSVLRQLFTVSWPFARQMQVLADARPSGHAEKPDLGSAVCDGDSLGLNGPKAGSGATAGRS